MPGRDNPKRLTRSKIYDLLAGVKERVPEIKAKSINTEFFVDDADGQEWETLRAIGYETGDVVPVAHLTSYNSFNLTTTATSFDRNFNYSLRSSPPSDALSPTGTLQVGVGGQARVGTDETLTVRAVNATQDDEITGASVQAQTDGPVWSGFAEYTPTDTTAPIRWAIEAKTEPGNNASEIQSGPLVLGVKI